MLQGLYKVEMQTTRGSLRGVVYAYDDRWLGGNSAFAYVGGCHAKSDGLSAEMSVFRHRVDPSFRPLLGLDRMTLKLTGGPIASGFRFEGRADELPDLVFTLVMTPIDEQGAAPVLPAGPDPLPNGLYALDAHMFDGTHGGGDAGVLLLRDGHMRGGDGSFGYVGSYSSGHGRWKGEVVVHEHSPTYGNRILFGGREIGIGYSGTYTETGAVLQCMALAGKRSIRYEAVLKKIVDV